METRIIIADDHRLFRDGLRNLLEKQGNFKVVGEASNGQSLIQMAQSLTPDVIIMDIAMPELNGIEATRKLQLGDLNIKIIILSMHSDRRYVSEAFKAGAMAYLLKDCAFEELLDSIESAMRDSKFLSSRISNIVINDYINIKKSESFAFTILTPREREVLQLIAEGRSTKQIASQLHVSTKTIETHRKQMMNKLDIHSLPELTKFAIQEGITSI